MNLEQYERWKDFAIRMALSAFKGQKRPDTAWILARVERIFENLDEQNDWIEAIQSWDHNAPHDGHPLVCDMMTDESYDDPDHPGFWWIREIKDGQRPVLRAGEDREAWWVRREAHEDAYDERLKRWIAKYDEGESAGLDREMMAHERFDDDWFGPVRCCLRAGLDLACEPSAGVLGFTVGTLREMYPEGIPAWISEGFVTGEGEGAPADLTTCPGEASIWL